MKTYIAPLRKDGVCAFLVHTFVQSSNTDKSPKNILQQLKDYPNVGKVVYNRPRSNKAPDSKYLQSTILQLIATNIVNVAISDESPSATLQLSFTDTDIGPNYLFDEYWYGINIVPVEDYCA